MPKRYRRSTANGYKPRGVSSRNRALQWIFENGSSDAVFYFADDDNTYNVKLFDEVKY